MKRKSNFLLLSIFITACANAAPVITETNTATVVLPDTLTTTTEASPTPSLTPTQEGPQEGDVTTVTENGHEYTYMYTKLGETKDGESVFDYVRKLIEMYMMNEPRDNWIPFTISSTLATPGERSVVSMINKDFTTADIPADGKWVPLPISSAYHFPLMDRYFEDDPRLPSYANKSDTDKQIAFKFEMRGKGEPGREQAQIPITIAVVENGKLTTIDLNVTLSDSKGGVDLLITEKETIFKLAQDPSFVSTGYVDGIEYYAQVYGVDQDGKMLCRLAFSVPLKDVPDKALRKAIFIFPASLAVQKDQTGIGQTELSKALAHMSEKERIDAKQDLIINRASDQQ